MRLAAALFPIALLGVCVGCGYIGPIVPPSPKIPMPVSDLAVVERGDKLDVTFTPPTRTTDQFTIKDFANFQLDVNGKEYDVPVSMKPVRYAVPASDWTGKSVSIKVRTSIKENKNFAAWSNVVNLNVIPPLQTPVVSADATAQGYALTWPDEGAGVQYSIYRRGPTDKDFVQIGTADAAHYTDGTAEWSTPYKYEVLAHTATAESPMSAPVDVNHPDTFPPAVPAGLAVTATPDAIELSWDRNTEADLKGYYVYRASGNGKFNPIGDLTVVPSFTDHDVEHGKSYEYEVRSIDQTGNQSALSGPVSVTYP